MRRRGAADRPTHECRTRLPLQSGIDSIASRMCSGEIQLTLERLHSCVFKKAACCSRC